jgi:hypothetical protein
MQTCRNVGAMSATGHSDYDKETLTTREDQDGEVLTNKDDELSIEEAKERRQSGARRKSSLASHRSNVLANAKPDVDIEKDDQMIPQIH